MKDEYLDPYFLVERSKLALPAIFFIITACNPNGENASDAENLKAFHGLRNELRERGADFFQVTGGSRDMTHREDGFGCTLEDDEIIRLARDWQQLAVYRVSADRLFLVPVNSGREILVDGGFSERVIEFSHDFSD